jgi:hypothetical protein
MLLAITQQGPRKASTIIRLLAMLRHGFEYVAAAFRRAFLNSSTCPPEGGRYKMIHNPARFWV